MTTPWLSYVPYYVAEDIVLHPAQNPVGREKRFEAVALFADVSGFTAISEALGQTGHAGTEELTTVLNQYFGPMIDLIQSYGGIIGKFGGDAMTALFPYTIDNRVDTVQRAIQCALEMQGHMHRYQSIPTSAGTFSLTMKAGLAMGPIFCTTIGDPDIRVEYVIAGSVLDRCADAEHHANRGDVVIHNDLLDAAGPIDIVGQHTGFSSIGALAQHALHAPLVSLSEIPADADWAMKCYLPPAVAQLIHIGQSEFINEHRRVTILFVSFAGFDYDHDPEVGARLQTYLLSVVRTVHRYDGYLNKVDMGDKGSKYIVLFGAPVAHENDEERAVRCALDVLAIPGVSARVGINTGFVFSGQVGSDVRREYTVIGDEVNLAARLMQAAAPRQILMSGSVRRKIPAAFDYQDLPPIQVKGKAQPIDVCAVQGVHLHSPAALHEAGYTLPMIGRQAELQQIRSRLVRTLAGHGQIIGINAEAGMGKTRLKVEVAREATTQGVTYYAGECESIGTHISYLVWHSIGQGLFGIDVDLSPEAQRERLERELAAIDLALVPRMPLLGHLLNLTIPDNELTQSLDAQLRVELLQSLLLDCIHARAAVTPLLFFLEDCHWIDPLSLELLEFIGRNIADVPVMIVLIYRPPGQEHNPLTQVAQFPHFHEMLLGEFSPDEARRLIELKLAQLFESSQEVPAGLVERLTIRAQGNPFYIEEMINLIHDRGVDPYAQTSWRDIDLPDSLHSLIMSRIDQLQENEKVALKVASVIGRVFKARWVWGAYPPIGTPEATQTYLAHLSRLDLTPLDKPEPELEYIFRHITTQEVAYETLAFTMRATLHEAVADFIERVYDESLDRYLDVLAHHYGHSRNTDKQRLYFVQAGDAAQAAYANDAAMDYYQRALPLLAEAQQSALKRKLGEIWQLTGKWEEADTSFREALALAELVGDATLQAQCQRALGWLLWHKKRYDESLQWLRLAEDTFQQLGDWQGVSQTAGHMGFVFWEQGDLSTALEHFEEQRRIAIELGDQATLADAIGNSGVIYMDQGDGARALECYEQQHRIAATLGNRQSALYALGNMGSVYLDRGDSRRALEFLAQALQIATEIGYLRAAGMIIANSGRVYELQGEYSSALACYEEALAMATELGDVTTRFGTVGNIAGVYSALGRDEAAERLFEPVITLARSLNQPYFVCGFLSDEAILRARQQQWHKVLNLQTEALEIAIQLGDKSTEFKSQVALIQAQARLNQVDQPAAVAQLEAMLDQWPDDNAQASLHYTLWQIDPMREESRRKAADLFQTMHSQTPNVEYRQRYYELTGEQLPDPPALPVLSRDIVPRPGRLDTLLAQVEALVVQRQ